MIGVWTGNRGTDTGWRYGTGDGGTGQGIGVWDRELGILQEIRVQDTGSRV